MLYPASIMVGMSITSAASLCVCVFVYVDMSASVCMHIAIFVYTCLHIHVCMWVCICVFDIQNLEFDICKSLLTIVSCCGIKYEQ